MSTRGVPVPEGGTFQGRPPRGRGVSDVLAGVDLEERWSAVSRADRRAEVTEVSWLTRTGTLRLAFEVTDDRPFSYVPGNFVRIELHVPGRGYRRGTYCILTPPSEYRRFELLVRLIPDGRMSQHLASLRLGDVLAFRGPTGRSMLKSVGDGDVVLLATGVGVGPLSSLATTLLRNGFRNRIDLYWGLRLVDDICLTNELDRLAERYPNFSYRISLSQPPVDWGLRGPNAEPGLRGPNAEPGLRGPNAEPGLRGPNAERFLRGPNAERFLRGRVTESVPPLLPRLGGRRFFLAGNGSMTEEFAVALSELGVSRDAIYEEPYFNGRHVADPDVVAAIVDRFVATDRDRRHLSETRRVRRDA